MAAVSHFTDAGFALDTASEAAFGKTLEALTAGCAIQTLDDADKLCLVKDASGAELRIGLRRGKDGGWEIQTANPAFAGDGRAEVEVAGDASDPDYKLFEVRVSAHFAGGEIPIVFELADPREAASFTTGAKLAVDIAAFSYAPEVFADEAAYAKSQAKEKAVFAANYFIPSGSFFESAGGAMPNGSKQPAAYADFAGTVLASELRGNTHGGKFWHASVKTFAGAIFDVVLDPASLALDPKPGTIVSGRFWLSARVAR
jgi:hypothetical protein